MYSKIASRAIVVIAMMLFAAQGNPQDAGQYFEKGSLRDTNNGKADYSLSPGVYKLTMVYAEAQPREERSIEGIQITDKSIVTKEAYFEKGSLRLTATDNDGWASLFTSVSQWNDEKRDWVYVDRRDTNNGKADYSLSPGVYKLTMVYAEAQPREERSIEGIRVVDRQVLSLGEMFGGGNLPPIISASGPFEIGDGDGYCEVGEKVLFCVDIRDTDFARAEFLLNDRLLRSTDQPGKYEQVLLLSVPGDYRFAVRAKDKNGTLESYARTVPVSMQKERAILTGKHLPPNYGEMRSVKKCPQCGKEYGDHMAFCPYDGTKLIPVEEVVHGILDASLSRAGIDPTTPEALHAKQLGLDWLNPFASQEQIDKDIHRAVDDVIKK
jgi:hypothetical protein